MDRFRQKTKKDKPLKHVDKDNNSSNSFVADVNSIRENMKIKEILRTVKMNSSMRVKAPRGSKVLNIIDFNDNDDFSNEENNDPIENSEELASATNPDVIVATQNMKAIEMKTEKCFENVLQKQTMETEQSIGILPQPENENENLCNTCSCEILTNVEHDDKIDNRSTNSAPTPDVRLTLNRQLSSRDRKLSLDHTLLIRRESLSQAEIDLNSIGKSPLERKSSFFRKKMDSFLTNTTKIFKKQSVVSRPQLVQRRGSMSASLHSLNNKNIEYSTMTKYNQGSTLSLQSTISTLRRSSSSLSVGVPAREAWTTGGAAGDAGAQADCRAGSQPLLSASQPIGDITSDSVNSLNEAYLEDPLLCARAISMSSGLDTAHTTRTRKSTNRSNRVTWVASEGLAHYFRHLIQDERSRELHGCQSYSDFTTILENGLCGASGAGGAEVAGGAGGARPAERTRRLSYQRAVSGEDPASRPDASLRRRHLIPEHSENISTSSADLWAITESGLAESIHDGELVPSGYSVERCDRADGSKLGGAMLVAAPAALRLQPIPHMHRPDLDKAAFELIGAQAHYELSNILSEFSRTGVPQLKGFAIAHLTDEALAFLLWAERPENLDDYCDLKKLPLGEEARQAVIRELVSTEAVHIRHLKSVVEVFIAAAHALQDAGKLLDIDTEKLFSNIPDVLNASLIFWDITIYPMLADAVGTRAPFNTEFMSNGFCRFREIFSPYEKFVSEQTKALDYLRSLSNHADFMMYLTWCHSQKECNRLQLSDILVKPMQRLTKYSLILRRVVQHTDTEPERTSLIAMENFSKNYVLDLNRSIRQREELEKLEALANSIESYDLDFKDEDLDRYFRMFAQLNLKAPMVNCLPSHSRTVIHQGDVRYKDKDKEVEVRAFLLTDMLLICKKNSKGSAFPFKMIRPKYMVDKMLNFGKPHPRNAKELLSLTFVMLDEVGSSYQAFSFLDTQKERDPNMSYSLKLWEQKIKEARLTYDLGVWFAKNPSRDLSEVEMDSSWDYAVTTSVKQPGVKQSSDDLNIEREARERVAVMLHRSMGASTEYDFSQASLTTDSFDAAGEASGASGARTPAPALHGLRHPMHRNSTGGSSRNSRLSSFQQSTSAASHDEPQAGPNRNAYRAGSSVEHLIPPLNPDDTVTSITVNVVSESESETVVPQEQPQQSRSGSRSLGNTLRVQPQGGVLALVHSLPDLTVDPSPPRQAHSPSLQSASEKLYQSHQELLQRNRLSAHSQQHYLTPDHRGTSYPPPSPTRASLKRGLAFSYSFKYPPLSKMGHVNSQSQLQVEAGTSTSQQAKGDKGTVSPEPGPSASPAKPEKKSKQFISRNNNSSGRSSASPFSGRKEDKKD